MSKLKKIAVGAVALLSIATAGLGTTGVANASESAAFAAGVAAGAAASSGHHVDRHHHKHYVKRHHHQRCHLEWRRHHDGRRYQVKICVR